ncbi:signal peptide peptidase SppA [Lujinxingia sediminis]|uniref:Signal peptide peptidase SppA n=1 Tax=Lujinxingia sediminis TaxID=2480984 RepID=A0ABY0CX48_9DELT|nr:signal peptide peptidase SppA [Lujinxingia sediminis]RVU48467.1 signal peptide peptidase SppA [Lujinxingia sediminis]
MISPRQRIALLLSSLALTLPASLAAQPSPSQGVAVPDSSLTTQADSASLEINPAGVGFVRGSELGYRFFIPSDTFDDVLGSGHAASFALGNGYVGLGGQVQWLKRRELGPELGSYRKYTLGAAVAVPRFFSVGVGINMFGSRSSERLNDLTTLDVGMQWRVGEHLGLGMMVRDAMPAYLQEDSALPTRLGLGLALRGFEGRLVFDTELYHVRGERLVSVEPRVMGEVFPGLRLFARGAISLDTEREYEPRMVAMSTGAEMSLGLLGTSVAALLSKDAESADVAFNALNGRVWLGNQRRRSVVASSRRWVRLDLDNSIAEQAVSQLLGPSTRSFLELMQNIDAMANDPTVEGVILGVGNFNLGYGQLWELHQGFQRLHEAGKHSVALMSSTTTAGIYAASAAREVWMLPATPYAPTGLQAELTSYQGLLENLGVEAEFVRIGAYKSAPEAFVNPTPSEEALEQTGEYVEAIYDELTRRIALRRGLEPDAFKSIVDNAPLLPDEALDQGLVDALVYDDELSGRMRDLFGSRVRVDRGYRPVAIHDEAWGLRPEIAVVYIDGAIIDGGSGRSPLGGSVMTGAASVNATLRQLASDHRVKAVVLRIDSPGGSALASDLIYREVRALARTKPVIASMGNVAASGGYYVAAGADEIFATPNTLTGSIGIFAGKFNFEAFANRLGVTSTPVQRGERAGVFSLWRGWSEEELEGVSETMTYLYQLFLTQASAGRPLSADELDKVARGRVWTGTAAQEAKLVDSIGGILDAVRRAEELAGLTPDRAEVTTYGGMSGLPAPQGFGAWLRAFINANTAPNAPRFLDHLPQGALRRSLETIETQALWPLYFEQGQTLMLPAHPLKLH